MDSCVQPGARPILNIRFPLAGYAGLAAALLGLGVMIAHGFDMTASGWPANSPGALLLLSSLPPSSPVRSAGLFQFPSASP
jgi:hypothetical protein